MIFLSQTRQISSNDFYFLLFLIITVISCGKKAEQDTANKKEAKDKIKEEVYAPDGMAVFRKYCVTCHGSDGALGLNGAKNLTACNLPIEERINIITNGRKLMTPFGALLTSEEIKAVADYTLTLKK